MVRLLGHRQTKGAATDKPNLSPPRHISTLQMRLARNTHLMPKGGLSIDTSYQAAGIIIESDHYAVHAAATQTKYPLYSVND